MIYKTIPEVNDPEKGGFCINCGKKKNADSNQYFFEFFFLTFSTLRNAKFKFNSSHKNSI